MNKTKFSADYDSNLALLDGTLRTDKSFDLVGRDICVGSKRARMYFVDGFVKDDTMVKIMQYFMGATDEELQQLKTTREFATRYVSYTETDVVSDLEQVVTFVLSGALALVVEGYGEVILIDARTYPARSVGEPENDKVLRGPHDGFVETVIFNTAMIRRRIRTPALTMEYAQVGKSSKTDVVMCYIEGKADEKTLSSLRKKIKEVKVNSLTMSQESLSESLVHKHWYNPFPKVRYTERPDAAAACINEGSVVIIVDNSPSAMIVPTGVFDFLQDTNDYYFPPLIGSYIKIIRLISFGLTVMLTPVWFLLINNPEIIPGWLSFITLEEPFRVPIIVQLLIAELIIDALKLASLNTPSALSNSFSVIGALVLGDFAVQSQWFVAEVVLYMAFVALANFSQPSFELGYAFKLSRVMILLLTQFFNYYGFFFGLAVMALLIAFNKTISGRCYLYPLIPFKPRILARLLFRMPISEKNN